MSLRDLFGAASAIVNGCVVAAQALSALVRCLGEAMECVVEEVEKAKAFAAAAQDARPKEENEARRLVAVKLHQDPAAYAVLKAPEEGGSYIYHPHFGWLPEWLKYLHGGQSLSKVGHHTFIDAGDYYMPDAHCYSKYVADTQDFKPFKCKIFFWYHPSLQYWKLEEKRANDRNHLAITTEKDPEKGSDSDDEDVYFDADWDWTIPTGISDSAIKHTCPKCHPIKSNKVVNGCMAVGRICCCLPGPLPRDVHRFCKRTWPFQISFNSLGQKFTGRDASGVGSGTGSGFTGKA